MQHFNYTCPECGEVGTIHTSGSTPGFDVPCQDCCVEKVNLVVRETLERLGPTELPTLVTLIRERTGLEWIGPLRMMSLDVEWLRLHLRRVEGVEMRTVAGLKG